jgi:hypothetical protein
MRFLKREKVMPTKKPLTLADYNTLLSAARLHMVGFAFRKKKAANGETWDFYRVVHIPDSLANLLDSYGVEWIVTHTRWASIFRVYYKGEIPSRRFHFNNTVNAVTEHLVSMLQIPHTWSKLVGREQRVVKTVVSKGPDVSCVPVPLKKGGGTEIWLSSPWGKHKIDPGYVTRYPDETEEEYRAIVTSPYECIDKGLKLAYSHDVRVAMDWVVDQGYTWDFGFKRWLGPAQNRREFTKGVIRPDSDLETNALADLYDHTTAPSYAELLYRRRAFPRAAVYVHIKQEQMV